MLDLNHPQTKHIFRAAKLEDDIRPFLVAAEKEGRELREDEIDSILSSLDQLDRLNETHFDSNTGISRTIDHLRISIQNHHSIKDIWSNFIDLAETDGDNFGTFAI